MVRFARSTQDFRSPMSSPLRIRVMAAVANIARHRWGILASRRAPPPRRGWRTCASGNLARLTERADEISRSLDAVVRQLVADARAFYGLAPSIVETLEKDRQTKGLDYRSYVQDLPFQRYRELLRAEFEADRQAEKGKR